MNTTAPRAHRRATGETSAEAAEMASINAAKGRQYVAETLTTGPASNEEIRAALARRGVDMLLNTIRARTSDMRRDGLVVDSGERGVGESGRAPVIKWRLATPAEREAWEAEQAAAETADEKRKAKGRRIKGAFDDSALLKALRDPSPEVLAAVARDLKGATLYGSEHQARVALASALQAIGGAQ